MPVLLAFYAHDGVGILNSMLRLFCEDFQREPKTEGEKSKAKVALFGLRKILDLYALIVSGKAINESASQYSFVSRGTERRPDVTIPPQLTVEIRSAVLPVMRQLWDSSLIEKASEEILIKVIDVLKAVSQCDHEAPAHKGDRVSIKTNVVRRTLSLTFV